jgi:hypothetical protein
MQELLVDFITSLDGSGAAEGWPGWWGLEGPEYLAWLGEQPERDYTIVMGANTYRVMSGSAAEAGASTSDEPVTDEDAAIAELARASKVVFSSTLQPPLAWPNTELIRGDAVGSLGGTRPSSSESPTSGSSSSCPRPPNLGRVAFSSDGSRPSPAVGRFLDFTSSPPFSTLLNAGARTAGAGGCGATNLTGVLGFEDIQRMAAGGKREEPR